MYDRLTKRTENGGVQFSNGEYWNTVYPQNENCLTDIHRMAIKLCDLEDKIEHGKILELPCAVGEKIFALSASRTKIYEFTIRGFLYNGKHITVYGDGSWGEDIAICQINEIGKGEVFIDRAAAEAKLREMEGERE